MADQRIMPCDRNFADRTIAYLDDSPDWRDICDRREHDDAVAAYAAAIEQERAEMANCLFAPAEPMRTAPYPHANALGEGANVSHKPCISAGCWRWVLATLVIEAAALLVIWAWRWAN